MALIVPNIGEELALKAFLNHTAGQNLVLKLFKNNITPSLTPHNLRGQSTSSTSWSSGKRGQRQPGRAQPVVPAVVMCQPASWPQPWHSGSSSAAMASRRLDAPGAQGLAYILDALREERDAARRSGQLDER